MQHRPFYDALNQSNPRLILYHPKAEGLEKFDAICMQLIAIGLKNLDKVTDKKLLLKYPQVDWTKAKGLRDIISHHYFDVNEEAIFIVCDKHMKNLEYTIK